jgi:hypothetical protein
MKNKTNRKPTAKALKDLATHFEEDLKKTLPIVVQPNGIAVYKNYFVKKNKLENWALHSVQSNDFVDQFFLKTCALMAAKALNSTKMAQYAEIKRLDYLYFTNFAESQTYTKNLKGATDFDRYLILLNKLENSTELAEIYKTKISTMFRWTFV